MTVTETTRQFVLDTFKEHHWHDAPHPSVHLIDKPEDWDVLRNKYDLRQRAGQGTTELPNSSASEGISVFFDAGPDRFLIVVDRQMRHADRISVCSAWIGIRQPGHNKLGHDKIVWLPVDESDLAIRYHDPIPNHYLETDTFTVSGALKDRIKDDDVRLASCEYGVPEA